MSQSWAEGVSCQLLAFHQCKSLRENNPSCGSVQVGPSESLLAAFGRVVHNPPDDLKKGRKESGPSNRSVGCYKFLNKLKTSHAAERWLSGRKRRIANAVYGQNLYLGFESRPLRQFSLIPALLLEGN